MKKVLFLLLLSTSVFVTFACTPIIPPLLSSEERVRLDKIYEQERNQEQMKRDIIISGKPSFVYLNNESDIFFFRDMRLDDKYYKIKIFERLGGLGDCTPGKFYAVLVNKNFVKSLYPVMSFIFIILMGGGLFLSKRFNIFKTRE